MQHAGGPMKRKPKAGVGGLRQSLLTVGEVGAADILHLQSQAEIDVTRLPEKQGSHIAASSFAVSELITQRLRIFRENFDALDIGDGNMNIGLSHINIFCGYTERQPAKGLSGSGCHPTCVSFTGKVDLR